ncbi:MAG: sugar phosphate isomerase/epimerase [Firmicutes bacterium]|nr:sugar phosphate isomerase/epimerase [Bacillota bacterium]
MIKIGRNIRDNFKYIDEVEFSRKNKFDFIQLWYDKNGLEVTCEGDSKLEFIKSCNFPTILHAMLDINELSQHACRLLEIAKSLDNKDLIIHPISHTKSTSPCILDKFSREVGKVLNIFKENGITLHIENNSKRMPFFSDSTDIISVLKKHEDLEILIDLAHVEDYSQIKEIVRVRKPKILHIADKRFSVVHEHLPIGSGEVNFKYIFSEILYDFNGTIILEINQDNKSIIDSKDKILSILGV